MRRLWLIALILMSVFAVQNAVLSVKGAAYHRWCATMIETRGC